jgi:NAD(P)-dependent dehydrogenase (short-subunit alcohol dehydrogenase family)
MSRKAKAALGLAAVGGAPWLLRRGLRSLTAFDFRDKVVLLTGGSRGLGLMLARQLTDAGARRAICARDQVELTRAADDLAQHGDRRLALPCDVTRPEQVEEMIRMIQGQLGPVDVLINDAGTIMVGPVRTMTRADCEENMAINFWGLSTRSRPCCRRCAAASKGAS